MTMHSILKLNSGFFSTKWLKIFILLFAIILTSSNVRGQKVLILSSSVLGGGSSLEALAAQSLGYTVDIVDGTAWRNMAATNPAAFSSYRAIILGDPNTNDLSLIAAAEDTKWTWSPRVNGNVILMGTDPADHASSHSGAIALTSKGISFAANETNKTGLYVSLTEYYDNAGPNTPLPIMEAFGDFKVRGQGPWDDVHIVAWHQKLNGLTDSAIGNWNHSVHEVFDKWPENFQVYATVQGIEPSPFLAQDGSLGKPYILLRSATNATFPITLLGCATSPYLINVQFGQSGGTLTNAGIAAIGHSSGDYWNVLNMSAGGQASNSVVCLDNKLQNASVTVGVSNASGGNLAGGSGSVGDDRLVNTHVFPPTAGTMKVTLSGVPAGEYDFYLYGTGEPITGTTQRWNAAFSILSGISGTSGTKVTSSTTNWNMNTWTENNQYVVFRDVQVVGGATNPVVIGVSGGSISNKPLINAMQIVRKSYKITGLSAVPASHSVKLSWRSVPGVTNYNIQRMSSSYPYYSTVAGEVTGTNYVDTGLVTGETYTYYVSAGSACAPVVDSSAVSATTFYTLCNVQFGGPYIEVKSGMAAIGNSTNDFWNVLTIDGKEIEEPSPGEPLVQVGCYDSKHVPAMVFVEVNPGQGGLPGGASDVLGTDPLVNHFLCVPAGGDMWITVGGLPAGTYNFYVYATGWVTGYPDPFRTDAQITLINTDPNNYSSSVLCTSSTLEWDIDIWAEGNQYVVFPVTVQNAVRPILMHVVGHSNISMPVINALQILRVD